VDDRAVNGKPKVGLFVTCLVDFHRPSVGLAAIQLLEQAGCTVEVPALQTCCGQPAYNSGDRASAARILRQVVLAFRHLDYVVAPSGSCAGMLRHHAPDLLADDSQLGAEARALAGRTHELTEFLADVMGWSGPQSRCKAKAVYHDSCSSLREMKVKDQPRRLLAGIDELQLLDLPDAEACCGFGGTFCVKFPDISQRMVVEKTAAIAASGADMVIGGDLGCLLNIAGRLSRERQPVQARHVAEVLADMTDKPAIGQ
jgi:L-lactate dehydrogenase complex protein LldE